MGVSGHAGSGVEASDADEGERVKAFCRSIIAAARHSGLNVTIHSMSPERWGLGTAEAMSVTDARAQTNDEPGANEATGLDNGERSEPS